MTTLIFQNYYTPYRAFLYDLVAENGADITVLYSQDPEDEGRKWSIPADLKFSFSRIPNLSIKSISLFWVPLRFLQKKYDVVILNDNNPTNIMMILYALLYRIIGRKCLLWVEHIPDNSKSALKARYQKACTKILSFLANGIIPLSAMTEAYLDALPVQGVRHRMIQATPFPERLPSAPKNARIRTFGYIGSNVPRKNFDILLNAFLAIRDPDIRLIVAGFESSSHDGRVIFAGYVDGEDREAFFDQVDALVLPSKADPWGLVVNEAMERGCACAVSDTCGSSEMVRRVDAHLVFPPEQDALLQTLTYLLSLGEQEVADLRARVKTVAVDYSMARAAGTMRDIIDGYALPV